MVSSSVATHFLIVACHLTAIHSFVGPTALISNDLFESAAHFHPVAAFKRPRHTSWTTENGLSRSRESQQSSSSSSLTAFFNKKSSSLGQKLCRARDLVQSLVQEDNCFTTTTGAQAFGDVCAINIVYEDRYEPQPFVGKQVASRKGKGGFRIDRISDGDKACGFAWTWTSGNEEGLRGTTYVELNDTGEIQYVQEIPEPIFKPGDLTVQLLEAVTKGAEQKPPQPFEKKTPTTANEVAKYLFLDLQNSKDEAGMAELISFFDEKVIYRDFNFENVLRGPAEVRKFVEDFSFPGIEFRPLRFDDGKDSCCFTWEVVLEGAPDTIKGMSFYELDPDTRKIIYVRDVPESAIKPPILGKLARQLRPGLGVFQGVPLGSRPGGM